MFSDGDSIINDAPTGAGEAHVTKKLIRYEIINEINVWDMWGLTPSLFRQELLEKITKGELPVNYTLEQEKKRVAVPSELLEDAKKRRCHSVLFFIPFGSLCDDEEVQLLRSCFAYLRDFNPIVLITRVDEKEPKIKAEPSKKFKNSGRISQES